MKPFKFVDIGMGPTFLEAGVAFDGYDSFMWTERYRLAGEFKISAKLSSGLKDQLPIGTLISHVDTYEVCVVENHQLKESKNSDPVIEISGRSLEAVTMENRIVGASFGASSPTPPPTEYTIASDALSDQIAELIDDHMGSGALAGDQLPYIVTNVFSSVPEGPVEARVIKRQVLHAAVLDLLAINDYGIRVIRRNGFYDGLDVPNTTLYIHRGNNKTDTVTFSSQVGDLEDAEYLWSSKTLKNVAYVKGRYVETTVYSGSETGLARRTMLVDASDLDESYDTVPNPTQVTAIRAKMEVRGRQALDNQQEVSITRADISKTSRLRYRHDYDIGDIVSIDGRFGTTEQRRVVEYVEIDENGGTSGHPTLAELPPNAIF